MLVDGIRRRLGGESGLVSDDVGYRPRLDPSQVDFRRFETLVDEGRTALDAGRPDAARALPEEAESLRRGRALAEFAGQDFATGIRPAPCPRTRPSTAGSWPWPRHWWTR